MSLYTTAIVSPDLPVRSPSLFMQGKLSFSTFLTRNEGTTDESKKRMLSAGAIQFAQESQKSNSLAWQNKIKQKKQKNITLLYISLPSLHDYHVKMPNFTFCEGRKQAMTKFILFMNLDMVDRNSAPEEFACI